MEIIYVNENMYAFQIINGTVFLVTICILVKLYFSLKDYNYKWRNNQHEMLF